MERRSRSAPGRSARLLVFALAPSLILIIALAGLILGREAAEGQIVAEVQDLVGRQAAEAIQATIDNAGRHGGLIATGFGFVSLLFGLWGSSANSRMR
jgi:membrane protein